MTMYAGETVRVVATGKDFDQATALTTSQVDNAFITAYDSADAVVLTRRTMTYSASAGGWTYLWSTTGLPAGTYLLRIEFEGPSSATQTYAVEYQRVRLNRQPIE